MKPKIFLWFSGVVVASVFIHTPFSFSYFVQKPGVHQSPIFTRLQTNLHYNLQDLGRVGVDNYVVSLSPETFTKKQVFDLRHKTKAESFNFFYVPNPRNEEKESFDSILFYNSSFGKGLIPFYIIASELPYMYRIVGTNVFLASNKVPHQMPAFQSILIPSGDYNLGVVFRNYVAPIFKQGYVRNDIQKTDTSFIIKKETPPGLILSTTPIRLPKGTYCIEATFEAADPPAISTFPSLTIEAGYLHSGAFFKKDLFPQDLLDRSQKKSSICFDIPHNLPHAFILMKFWLHQARGLSIKSPTLLKIR